MKDSSDPRRPLWRGQRQLNKNRRLEPSKEELEGELITFQVLRYEPAFVTQFGVKSKAVVSLFVLTGPLSGERFPDWSVVGPIAEQMASCPRGSMTGARVVARTSEAGHRYMAIDPVLTGADRLTVMECLHWRTPADGEVNG